MSRVSYWLRGLLYIACAVVPVLLDCYNRRIPRYPTVLLASSAGLLVWRAFIDQSPAQASAQSAAAATPPATQTSGIDPGKATLTP